tara:strand:- start:124 stop:702 length:579 start_codon:yes stop_codon:yes gene_type:complete
MSSLLDQIEIYDDVMSKEAIENFLSFVKKNKFNLASVVDAKSKTSYDKKSRDCYTLSLSNEAKNLAVVHWANFYTKFFVKQITEYKKNLNLNYLTMNKITSIEVLKYKKEGHFHPHTDHNPFIPRTLSCIFMLNDGYEGGDLLFYDPSGKDNILKINPRAGRLIIWPSSHLFPHAVSPVTNGERYTVVCWTL